MNAGLLSVMECFYVEVLILLPKYVIFILLLSLQTPLVGNHNLAMSSAFQHHGQHAVNSITMNQPKIIISCGDFSHLTFPETLISDAEEVLVPCEASHLDYSSLKQRTAKLNHV